MKKSNIYPVKSKKRLFSNGWTYAEVYKIWRLNKRYGKQKQLSTPSFKEWLDELIVIDWNDQEYLDKIKKGEYIL